MKYLDLFSGIGGFALGAYWAGMRFQEHYFSEVDPWAAELYQKRFPDAIPLGDIRGIDGKVFDAKCPRRIQQATCEQDQRTQRWVADTGGGWILTGGFPCQDISFAGKGAGLQGKRSGLWWEYHRLISELRPRYAIVENVRAFTVRGLDVVLGSLADIGFDAEWDCIRASDVGAPHRRERIWIVAYSASVGDSEQCSAHQGTNTTRKERAILSDKRCGDAAYAGRELLEERRTGNRDGRRRTTIEPCGSRQDYWTTEPDVGRLAHGIPHRVDRLRGLGNAIVPQIAQLIFERIGGRTYERGS